MNNQKGFNLIELIIVVIIVGIISYLAVVRFGDSSESLQYESIIKKLASDVRYAQQLAQTEGLGTQVHIDQFNNRYYLKWSDGQFIKNPVGGGDFIIQLGVKDFSKVQITATGFNGGRLDFDKSGRPLNAGVPFSGILTLVVFNNRKKIEITGETGLIKIKDF